jgi:hypothetical protein
MYPRRVVLRLWEYFVICCIVGGVLLLAQLLL